MFNLLSERKYKVSLKWKDMFYILSEQLFKATDWISCKIKKNEHQPLIFPVNMFRILSHQLRLHPGWFLPPLG